MTTATQTAPIPDLFPGMRAPAEVFREIRNYLAGQMVGATRDESLLHEVIKVLFVKLKLERSGQPGNEGDPLLAAKQYRQHFSKIRAEYPELFQPDEELLLDPRSLAYVIRSLDFPLLSSSQDPVGELFQVFAGSESRGGRGQFFTPKNAVDLLVEAVEPGIGELIIDPACGAGGFLSSVVQLWRANGVPEAEISTAANKRLIGIEKDDYLASLARAHISLLTDAHSRIVPGDSLAWASPDGKALRVPPRQTYDVVLTNPPFGTKIVAAITEVLRNFELGHKWSLDKGDGKWIKNEVLDQAPPQVLFVERCLSLLKEGGRLGMVVPESLVSNKSYEHVINYLKQHARIQAVIGMPEALFKTSGKGGTHTKTCLIVAHRTDAHHKQARVFMAEAKWCGHDSRGRSIPHDDLPAIREGYSTFKRKLEVKGSSVGFTVPYKDIMEGAVCPRYFDPTIDSALDDLRVSHELRSIDSLVQDKTLEITTGDEVGKLAYGTGDVPFVRTSDISSWEIKVDPKHSVSEDIFNALTTKQDVRSGDILMVRDGTYLIGSCALITKFDTRIVYQSHIYKIRVHDNAHGLDPYLLLAILSSPIVQKQIRAKQFTQDIIDSLGRRINELVLPIPKSQRQRHAISTTVKESIDVRVKARELARRARLAVMEVS